MTPLGAVTVGIVVAVGGVTGQRPYPIYTADHLAATMETLGPNFAATLQSVDASDWAAAKQRLVRSREQLATTITFWRDRDKNDAVEFLRTALRGMDDLDAVMSAAPVDADRTRALAAEIQAACDSCHRVYREEDPATGELRLKRSAVE